ncbi:MAG: mechanosensitive ion channel [Chloroflexota bacterium]|jgi:small-conductance mechanosensitive channel
MDFLNNFTNDIWSNDLYRNLILSFVVLAGIVIARAAIQRLLLRRYLGDANQVYTLGKVADYAVTAFGFLLLFAIWVQRSTDLTVVLGLIAAGLAFALQEVIGSIAGWLSIIFGRPFTLGDRIETGGIHGDVVDISVLRTTLMETGNWLGGMQATGRIVTVSNAFLFKEPLFNYSREIIAVWDEVGVSVPYGQNWSRAKEIMVAAVENHPDYIELVPIAQIQLQQVQRKLAVTMSPMEPRTYTKMTDSWIEIGVVYPVAYNKRRGFRSDITEKLLREFAAEGIPIAFPTMTVEGIVTPTPPASANKLA